MTGAILQLEQQLPPIKRPNREADGMSCYANSYLPRSATGGSYSSPKISYFPEPLMTPSVVVWSQKWLLTVQGKLAEKSQGRIELDGLMDEVEEKGYKPPPAQVLKEATRIFFKLHGDDHSKVFSVSPGQEGDISIDAHAQRDYVMLICDPDGSAFCLTSIGGEKCDKSYASTFALPDEFIRKSISSLDVVANP